METRSGNVVPFVEEQKNERVPKPPTKDTRSNSVIPIIEEAVVEKLTGSRLPTRLEVFAHFFYLHKNKKETLQNSKREAIKAAASFWEKVSIAPKTIKNGVRMLTRIHDEYQVVYQI